MLFARYWLIDPGAGDRRLARRARRRVPAGAGTLPTHTPLFVVHAASARDPDRRRADLRARRSRSGPIVEHLHADGQPMNRLRRMTMTAASRATSAVRSGRSLAAARSSMSFVKLDPRRQLAQPGDVRRLRRQHPHDRALCLQALGRPRARRRPASSSAISALAVVHGAVRQLRRGDGRRPRQGAGRHAAQRAQRDITAKKLDAPRDSATLRSRRRLRDAAQGRRRPRRGRRHHSRRRRGHRRRRLGRRERHHRRIARRSSASPAATAARSPAARACSPTGSSSASPPTPARPSSTA